MNKTPNFDLPLYEPTDITSWMGEDGFNGAMTKIDTGMAQNAAASTGAQSTANNAYNLAENTSKSLARYKKLPKKLNATFLKNPGENKTFWTYDEKREMLYINGVVVWMSFPSGANATMFKVAELNPASPRTIYAPCTLYNYDTTANKYVFYDTTSFIIQPNGEVQTTTNLSDLIGSRCTMVVNCSLSVQDWWR